MKLFAKTVIKNSFGKHCVGVSSLIKLLAALKKEAPVEVFTSEYRFDYFCIEFKIKEQLQ